MSNKDLINDFLGKNFDYKPPQVYLDTPDIEELDLTLSEIRELGDDELLKLLTGEADMGMVHSHLMQVISHELISRQIRKASRPHWTVYAVLLLTFIAATTGVVAILK